MWDGNRRWGIAFHVDDLGRGSGGGGAAGPVLSAGELFAVDLRWMLSIGWTPGGAK
jgi:hypothetical protein